MKHFVLRWDFLIEHGNLGVPVRKILRKPRNFELLQCKRRRNRGWAKQLRDNEAWLESERLRHITRLHTACDAVAEIGKTCAVFLRLRKGLNR